MFCIVCWNITNIVEAYSSVGLFTALYVESNVSLSHLVKVRTEYWYSFGCFGCPVNNVFVVSEFKIEGLELLICRLSLMLYSGGSGVKSVQVVFTKLSMRRSTWSKRVCCIDIVVCVLLLSICLCLLL